MDILFDRVVQTLYGQFRLIWGDDGMYVELADQFEGQANGWLGAAVPTQVELIMARPHGGSSVRIESWEIEPAVDDSWDDIVEVSFTVTPGATVEWGVFDGVGGQLPISAGSYRLRAGARGRDSADDLPDQYLLQLWPAARSADAVLRTTSKDAAYWNATWGARG